MQQQNKIKGEETNATKSKNKDYELDKPMIIQY
jgi:hypothetical protein